MHAGLLSITRAVDDYTLPDRIVSRDRTPVRAAWETVTAKTYGYSISREDGIAVGVTAELVRRALGSSADATTLDRRRARRPAGIGAASRDRRTRRRRRIDRRSDGRPDVSARRRVPGRRRRELQQQRLQSPARLQRRQASRQSCGADQRRVPLADRAAAARVSVRADLASHHHAAAFADVGHAGRKRSAPMAIKTSVGGELAANIVAGYVLPFTATVGTAWGHDGQRHACRSRHALLPAIGKAF